MSESIKLTVTKSYRCEVLVIGGGVAGISAAVCAAREGADTMLCEQGGCLGGTATAGLVGPFMSAYDPTGDHQVIKGFMEELIRRMAAKGGAIPPEDCPGGDGHSAYRINGHIGVTPFDPEALKLTAEECCEEAGVRLLYHMFFVSCEKDEDGRITAAYFATKNGIHEVRPDVVVDCTGDADVAVSAGAPFVYGDENGNTQVASVFFMVDHVDKEKLEKHIERYPEKTDLRRRYFEDVVEEEQKKGTFPCGRSRVSAFESVNDIWRVNMTQYDKKADLTDPECVTDAEITCRKQIAPLMEFFRKHVPGFEKARVLRSADVLGIRESRRILGEKVLTIDDMAAGTRFEDAICTVGSAVDFHGSQKKDGSYDGKYYVTGSHSVQIPYRALLPKNVSNLIVAGRCLSADQLAHSAVRVMPPCFAMGQAAGVAAAMAAENDGNVKNIDLADFHQRLVNGGVYFE